MFLRVLSELRVSMATAADSPTAKVLLEFGYRANYEVSGDIITMELTGILFPYFSLDWIEDGDPYWANLLYYISAYTDLTVPFSVDGDKLTTISTVHDGAADVDYDMTMVFTRQ